MRRKNSSDERLPIFGALYCYFQRQNEFQKFSFQKMATIQHRWNKKLRKNLFHVLLVGTFTMTFLLYMISLNFSPNLTTILTSANGFFRTHTKSQKFPLVNQNKWIVLTSGFERTEEVAIKLSQVPAGWQLLVIADKNTSRNWTSIPNVIFLDTNAQLKLEYGILKFLPWNSYTRKVIGYLFAIRHGAQFIFDADREIDPVKFESSMVLENTTRGLLWTNDKDDPVTNPYAHFGQSFVWPRGYPLELIGKPVGNFYTTCRMKTPMIQQIIGKGDAELKWKNEHARLDIHFDSSAPPMILPQSVLASCNSRNTLFHYNAFWALLLPVTVTPSTADIWRGYWAQPLLWGIGGHLGFYPQDAQEIPNFPRKPKDYQLNSQSGSLVTFLKNWKCTKSRLYDCMIELATDMTDHKFWSSKDADLLKTWIADLKSIGYKEPEWVDQKSSPCLKNSPESFVRFESKNPDVTKHRNHLRTFCNLTIPTQSTKNQSLNRDSMKFPNTLLIVAFNIPHYENIWLLDLIYRPHYSNILYCGSLFNTSIIMEISKSKNFVSSEVQNFSFVHANVTNGFFIYECTMRAIEMKYSGITGYMAISDDIMWNFWNTQKYNPHEMWFPMSMQEGNQMRFYNIESPPAQMRNVKITATHTYFELPGTERYCWNLRFGYNATKSALAKIYNLENKNRHVQQFRQNREKIGFNSSVAVGAFADLFYLAEFKRDVFYEIATIFREHEVYLEIGIPMLVTGLSSPKDIIDLAGFNRGMSPDWFVAMRNFSSQNIFIHSIKISRIIADVKLKTDYCENYISHVLRA